MDPVQYNRDAWDREVESGTSPWTRPVSADVIARARRGEWSVVLTMTKPVPRAWFGPDGVAGKDVLCLASAGGQQAPVLAAAGARVTSLDNSPAQLAQDRLVAERDALTLRVEEGDMRDLTRFPDASFDVVFHATSNLFVPDVRPVWREAFRVLRPGGRLLSGFMNPAMWVFDADAEERGELVPRFRVPYADVESLPAVELAKRKERGHPLEWSHTLTDQIGGQADAGFLIAGLYEDDWGGERALDRAFPTALATLALKPVSPLQ